MKSKPVQQGPLLSRPYTLEDLRFVAYTVEPSPDDPTHMILSFEIIAPETRIATKLRVTVKSVVQDEHLLFVNTTTDEVDAVTQQWKQLPDGKAAIAKDSLVPTNHFCNDVVHIFNTFRDEGIERQYLVPIKLDKTALGFDPILPPPPEPDSRLN
jgi:hypothetical protein